ncbi:SGNH/GDSL hydrolase family protein [Mucilaginibacter sp. PAMB04274]|uniref:SGNH/GDSL hydrolase family protein n=1 Tax=Mucilaginibacter sp. PAMB04274 TaxID=3138568 RepID=UPI0031F640A9
MGRVDIQPERTMLAWSGTSAKINFNGTGVKAVLQDEGGNNYYNVIIDGTVTQRIQIDAQKHAYTLAANLPKANHTLELFKLTEWAMGKTWLYEFDLDAGSALLAAPAIKKHKIEFFGNSITCGFAVLDTTGKDRGSAPYEDNYQSYAAITARHFDAEYYCTARSGIGVLVSWFPQIMPEMYDKVDPSNLQLKWDFTRYTPDLVVINLFQNDSWLVEHPEHPEFKARFGDKKPTPAQIVAAYQSFVKTIRSKYPKAQIICALGSMDASREGSPWPGYIKQAVVGLKDKSIQSFIFPAKNTPGHPSKKEQMDMANQLIGFIDKNVKW